MNGRLGDHELSFAESCMAVWGIMNGRLENHEWSLGIMDGRAGHHGWSFGET